MQVGTGRKSKRIRTVGADRNYLGMGQSVGAISNSASPSEGAKFWAEMPVLPLAVVEEVLLNVPPEEVVCVCRLVCREWQELVDSAPLWKEKCRRARFLPHDVTRPPADWRMFYFMSKKRHNLLKNPSAEEQFNGWQIVRNGGDRWSIQEVGENPLPDEMVKKFFVTSYHECKKLQLINLEREGYKPALLDRYQPEIHISDWYAPRWDCGCMYEICVELLNQKKQVMQTFAPEPVYFQQWNEQQWHQMTHVFRDYGPGARFVRFCHGGNDTKFWAGWYGIRVTNSSVEVLPAGHARSTSPRETRPREMSPQKR
ncbi:F-box only protein 44-like isoform X2 [Conger conger]|nr:F-box only protein 44-like isoform X2 [Conger conger]XP_061114951.1 F-box only protein 44-like isoform X2 [Conger conger]XP_061114952.1 F-box only protein 44-like isoform X2 [Conger conger]